MLNILDILEPSDFILEDEETGETLDLGKVIPDENPKAESSEEFELADVEYNDYCFRLDKMDEYLENEDFDEE